MTRSHQPTTKQPRKPRPSPIDRRGHRGVTKSDVFTGRQVFLTAEEIAKRYGGRRTIHVPWSTNTAPQGRKPKAPKSTEYHEWDMSGMTLEEIEALYGPRTAHYEAMRR